MNNEARTLSLSPWLIAAILVFSVGLVAWELGGNQSHSQWVQTVVKDIRADVLMGNRPQIEAKLAKAQKEHGLLYLNFEENHSGLGWDRPERDWELASRNDPLAERFPVEVGGMHYGWLSFAPAPKSHYALIFVFGLWVGFYVFYVQPSLFPWHVYFPSRSSSELDSEVPGDWALTSQKNSPSLGTQFTAFRSVQGGYIELVSPNIRMGCGPFPAVLAMRELAVLATGNYLYRPAYKWLLVSALRGMGSHCGLHGGVRLLLPITGLQLIDRVFFEELNKHLLIQEVQVSQVVIEIHESVVGQHTEENLTEALKRFGQQGFGICVDGFGSTEKSEQMIRCGPVTHVKWAVDSTAEWTSAYWLQKGQALAKLVKQSGVRVIRVGIMESNTRYPLAAMVSIFTHERPMHLSRELQTALHRQLLAVTYQDVYRHAV